MSEELCIGVDHGYAAMKTPHFSFPSGLVAYEHEPYTQKDVLEYEGKYYVVGSGRQPLQKDKTRTEDYYLLTLAAIAKELEYRNASRTCSVVLAAGLPLTSFGRDKAKFCAYLLRSGRPALFRYEGTRVRGDHIRCEAVSPRLCGCADSKRAAGRAVRHCGRYRRLDRGSDAFG